MIRLITVILAVLFALPLTAGQTVSFLNGGSAGSCTTCSTGNIGDTAYYAGLQTDVSTNRCYVVKRATTGCCYDGSATVYLASDYNNISSTRDIWYVVYAGDGASDEPSTLLGIAHEDDESTGGCSTSETCYKSQSITISNWTTDLDYIWIGMCAESSVSHMEGAAGSDEMRYMDVGDPSNPGAWSTDGSDTTKDYGSYLAIP